MKKEEKTRLTYEKIINAAMEEFGTKSYDTASLNAVCETHKISKGLIYHNFKNKDELYLCCVKICFREMMEYISKKEKKADTVSGSVQNFIRVRGEFFEKNPYYRNIFFNVLLQPPIHLLKELREIRRGYDLYYRECCRELLGKIRLREGITDETALECLIALQEMFNGYFQSKSYEQRDFRSLIEDHELKIGEMLDIMLYGIAKKPTEGEDIIC